MRARRRASWLGALALVALGAGCTPFRTHRVDVPDAGSIAASEWPIARTAAQQAAVRGNYARADSILRAFTASYPGTEAASDALFYRGVFRLDLEGDSARSSENAREARAALDAYLAGGPMQQHYAEALTLRRLASQLDSLHTIVPVPPPVVLGTQSTRDTLRARDDEIVRLRAELDQTKAELDRLRRRLTPRP